MGKVEVLIPLPQGGREIPLERVRRIRKSVEEGIERVVMPFLKRVEAQSRIPNSKRRYRSAA